MVVSLSAAVLLAVLVYLIWRYANVRAWHITLCVLLGFYLASSSIGPHIGNVLHSLAHGIARLHF